MRKLVELKMEKDYIKVFDMNKVDEINEKIIEEAKRFIDIEKIDEDRFLNKLEKSGLMPQRKNIDTSMLEEYISAGSDIHFILRRMIIEQTKDSMDDFIIFFNNFIILNSIVLERDLFLENKVVLLSNAICERFNELFDA